MIYCFAVQIRTELNQNINTKKIFITKHVFIYFDRLHWLRLDPQIVAYTTQSNNIKLD